MRSLKEIIDEAGERNDRETILAGFIGYINDEPQFIYAILERTAVYFKLGEETDRHLSLLSQVMVWPQDIKWIPRTRRDATQRQSVRRGHTKGRQVRWHKEVA